ncbi:hypothetical protein MHLP_01315 [Candidatus Mycoplasma haematolamae str. Purdue]|uniref:Uncharacterized protein n=1 Tax=Mycoplasma haematolamae (strain Purdue) TaxID=1212765 RepID=I7BJ32_MYCHA|nr:hypothetical protein [Candidatus Mycoplasma haematolamae]AFO51843.1 hypothetical protein MHLP_01315 [Candidatus Mycoplasma haematolamae str. Purdue]
MFKEVAFGAVGLGTLGGAGAASGFFGRTILETTGLIVPAQVTYTVITGDGNSDTQTITCRSEEGKYPSLSLTSKGGDYLLRARLSCTSSDTKPLNTIKLTLESSNEVICQKSGGFGTYQTIKCSCSGKTLSATKEQGNPPKESVVITLKG